MFRIAIGLCCFMGWLSTAGASGQDDWKRGVEAFKAYQFQQAIPHLNRVLVAPPAGWSASQKARAYLYLSLCHYNLGQTSRAQQVYRRAHAIESKVSLPKNMPSSIRKVYSEWRAKLERASKPRAVKRPVPVRRPIRRVSRKKRVAQPLRRRVVAPPKARVVRRAPPKRQVALRRATPAPPKPGFPHTASLVTLGIGLALVGAGVGVGVVSLEANRQSDTLAQQGPKAHAGKLQEAYQHAQTMAWVHTGLWIASGLTLAAAGGLFLYERSRKPKSPASPVASGALTSPTGARQGQGTHLFELSL